VRVFATPSVSGVLGLFVFEWSGIGRGIDDKLSGMRDLIKEDERKKDRGRDQRRVPGGGINGWRGKESRG